MQRLIGFMRSRSEAEAPACISSRLFLSACDTAPSREARLDTAAVFADIGGLAEVVIDLPRFDGLIVAFAPEFAAG